MIHNHSSLTKDLASRAADALLPGTLGSQYILLYSNLVLSPVSHRQPFRRHCAVLSQYPS